MSLNIDFTGIMKRAKFETSKDFWDKNNLMILAYNWLKSKVVFWVTQEFDEVFWHRNLNFYLMTSFIG